MSSCCLAFGAGFDNAYFGGPPWEMPDVYIEKSPLFRMHTMKTPTLIMFGTRDTNVPTGQGWQHFRAMQQSGAAPVRFILFPGAGKKDQPGFWDLAGNVSEWTVTEDGKGKVMGLSAVSPRDKRCEYTPPPPGYVGFRVVEEQ